MQLPFSARGDSRARLFVRESPLPCPRDKPGHAATTPLRTSLASCTCGGRATTTTASSPPPSSSTAGPWLCLVVRMPARSPRPKTATAQQAATPPATAVAREKPVQRQRTEAVDSLLRAVSSANPSKQEGDGFRCRLSRATRWYTAATTLGWGRSRIAITCFSPSPLLPTVR
jgi:hypothetical protein